MERSVPLLQNLNNVRCSIALCTYFGEKYIREQLASFVAQTVRPAELLIVDDLSSDSTLDLVGKFSRECSFPVRVIQNERRLGPGRNFFKALEECAHPIVLFSDQDDVWLPSKIEKTLRAFSDESVLAVATDASIVGPTLVSEGKSLWKSMGFQLNPNESSDSAVFDHLLKRGNFIAGMSLAVRKDFALAQRPLPDAWLHDGWLSLTAAAAGGLRLVHEELSLYRQHGNNAIGVPRLSVAQIKKLLGYDKKKIDLEDAYEQGEIALERLGSGLSDDHKAFLLGRLKHLKVRLSLPSFRPARLPLVMKELRSGGYQDYSAGFLGAARDLLRMISRR